METMNGINEGTFVTPFLPYLWGMETDTKGMKTEVYKSSYRTYEEWKHKNQNRNNK